MPEQPTTSPADGLPLPRRYAAIAAISFGTALFVIDGNIANVALPTIARDLGVAPGAVVAVVTLYQLVLVMALLPFANFGDRIGHRRLYQAGQAIFMAASALTLLANSFHALLAVRVAQALGAGMALSVSAAMLRQIYSAKSLGSGLGINSVIVASSNALAPTLGGLLVAQIDWRWVFVAAVPMAALSLLIGRALPEPEPRHDRFDWPGGLWSAATFGLVIGGMELAIHGSPAPGLLAVAAGAVAAVALVRREWTRERPVLPVDLLRDRTIGLSALAAIAGFMASSSLIVSLPFRFEQGMGFRPDEVGLLILPYPLTLLFVAPAAGWLSDRINASLLGVTGMAMVIAGLLLVAYLPAGAQRPDIAWRLSLTAAGFGLFFAPNSRLIIAGAPRARAASAGGLLSTSRLLGQTLGASLVGAVLSLGLGLSPLSLMLAAGLALAAALASLVRLGRGSRAVATEPERTTPVPPAS